jgi:hypothetical protein
VAFIRDSLPQDRLPDLSKTGKGAKAGNIVYPTEQ